MLKRLQECQHQQKKNVVIYVLDRNLWKHQTDYILDVHITNLDAHYPTFIGNRKQSFVPKPAWTNAANAVTSLPLWFHATVGLEMEPRYCSSTKHWRKPYQEIRNVPRIPKLQNFVKSRMSTAIVQHACMHASEDHASPLGAEMSQHYPQWDDGAGLPLFGGHVSQN